MNFSLRTTLLNQYFSLLCLKYAESAMYAFEEVANGRSHVSVVVLDGYFSLLDDRKIKHT